VHPRHRHPAGQLCPECAAALTEAARLAGDDFLAGFELPDSQAFDEWLFFQRDRLRQQLAEALQALVGWHAATADYSAGIECARRWVALDPLHEPARRELMRLYAWAGQPSAAQRQYAETARLLDEELGAAPEPETTELYEAIKARRLAPPVDGTPGRPGPAAVERPRDDALARPAGHDLPRIAGFVGRQRELADIVRLLTDPSCRLLTLAGPGGIGKTRLALQAAQILADGWSGGGALPDGVLFVPLEAVGGASGLVSALAAAARLGLFPGAPAQQQVLDHFRDKQMLVVLDNFEQLIDAAGFVGELLAAAPHLRVLVTSRVALSLRDEWFYPIDGLSFPGADDERDSLAQLSRFVPANQLVASGLAPFVIGDVLKSALAAGLFPAAWKFVRGLEAK